MDHMRGIAMELEDCRFPLLKAIKYGCDMKEMLNKVDWCVMLASMPMLPGEERRDLIKKNTKLIKAYADVLNEVAHSKSKDISS